VSFGERCAPSAQIISAATRRRSVATAVARLRVERFRARAGHARGARRLFLDGLAETFAAAEAPNDTLNDSRYDVFRLLKTLTFFRTGNALRDCITLAASAILLAAAGNDRFDGTWDTVLSCENAAGAMGYSFKFPAIVKDGVLHGEKGTRGKPGWLQLDGKILSDGSAKIYADGLVGAAEFAVGRRPAGTQYGYHIEAKFSEESGTGKRVEGRPCSVTFARRR